MSEEKLAMKIKVSLEENVQVYLNEIGEIKRDLRRWCLHQLCKMTMIHEVRPQPEGKGIQGADKDEIQAMEIFTRPCIIKVEESRQVATIGESDGLQKREHPRIRNSTISFRSAQGDH